MTGDPHGAVEGRSDTRNTKRSRQDDLALLGTLRADARLPNRAKRIRALCRALDVPILPASPRRLRSMASPSSHHDSRRHPIYPITSQF